MTSDDHFLVFYNHFFHIPLSLPRRFCPTLLTMSLMFSSATGLRRAGLDLSSSLLKKALLEMEVEPENLLRFCLRVTLLCEGKGTRLRCP